MDASEFKSQRLKTFGAVRFIATTATAAALFLVGLGSCGDDPTGVAADLSLEFSQSTLDLGVDRSTTVEIRNSGNRAIGPIQLTTTPVLDLAGNAVPGSSLTVTPASVPTLNVGQSTSVTLQVSVGDLVQSGQYRGDLMARAGSEASASVGLSFAVAAEPTVEISALSITTTVTALRQGDVLDLESEALDLSGNPVVGLPILWTVTPTGSGFVNASGQLVAYEAGDVTVSALYGVFSASHTLSFTGRGLSGSATKIGTASVTDRHTSDVWVHGNYAYTGTWGQRVVGGTGRFGDQLNTWDISNPSSPVRTHTLTVDARTVNDVKVRADGALAILTHEGSNDGQNGITVLDLSDPSQPVTLSRFTARLESGIHSVWI